MQLFVDTTFFVYLILLSIPAIILGCMEKPIRMYGFLVSLLFIWFAMGGHTKALVFLIIFIIWQYAAAEFFLRFRERKGRNALIYWTFMILSIIPLAMNKYCVDSGSKLIIFGFLGISYMEFKALQVIIQIYDGQIKKIDTFSYIYMMVFFPVLTSGPIDRSDRFKEDIYRVIPKAEYIELVGTGIWKIVIGLLYKVVIATFFYQVMIMAGKGNDFSAFIVNLYVYGLYLFFDFAGYSLMAVGASYLFGIKSPSNFNKPFLALDLKDFWDRWHISLSHWFRDFVFSRITMDIMKTKKIKNRLVIASIAFIINMGIMGLWHGAQPHYLAYGLYHGVLLSLTEIFQKKSKFYKKHKKKRVFKIVSWFITFNLVMFGLLIFSGKLTKYI